MRRTPFDLKNVDKFLNAIQSEAFTVGIRNAKGDDPAELCVYDVVGKDWDGSGIGAKDVAGFLAENRGKPVNVRINSPGGLVFDGLTIYNSLIAHDGPTTAIIEGIAASIASIIAMGCDKTKMSAVGSMMVHRAIGVCVGNTGDMEDCGVWLDTIDNQLAAVYAAKTGRKVDTMKNYMVGKVDGTLFDAQAALDARLIDEIIPVRGDKSNARNEGDVAATAILAEGAKFKAGESVFEKVDEAIANEVRLKLAKARAAARLRVLEVSE